MTTAGTLLRYARRSARLSQRALAAAAGVTPTAVARIERGATPHFDTVVRLLATCGHELLPHPYLKADARAPVVRLDPKVRPVQRLFPDHRRGDPRPEAMRLLDRLAGTHAVVIGRSAAVLLGADIPWTHIDVCPGPDRLPDHEALFRDARPGGLGHDHLRRSARYVDPAELPMPRVAALFVADPLDLLVMAARDGDLGLVAAARAIIDAERTRPVLDEGLRRYPAHSEAREGDRLDPFAAVWRPVKQHGSRKPTGA